VTRGPRDYHPDEELRIRAEVKSELRARMRAIRRALPAESRAARSRAVVERLVALPEYESASVVGGFYPLRGEVDLRELFERAANDGKRLALPRVDLEADELVLHRWSPGDPLEEGPYELREPPPSAETVEASSVDLLICPALALDEAGHRIGYGRGYYDRLLPRCTRAFSCGVAFDFQLISEVPAMPGDVPMRAVVTDARTTLIAPS
jgi:5-formyltetrahydrofolate cyclo-ligase